MIDLAPWLLGLAIVALVWWRAMGARSAARRAAQAACEEADVIFIDELAFKRIGFSRDGQGSWRLTRRYGFEFYSRGDRRYAGTIEMHGQRVVRVYMGPRPV
ncbi:DUF3301 domain-containing protein [Salinisphaera hydrothermalis]|uniref:DUF3301 domain-containing protein n=1 Tax=Salinisphaera hydrothermalis (strain C41B8) TaxID=1304275 RepID=A0A084IM33_SALHC|nr:DUF3301 domain-containing protein [Salinisphaera hydrothermalis]KEZ77767.1 hypothetical protein C41B8_08125 [Salinisphaera hydrothermalis C41B8]